MTKHFLIQSVQRNKQPGDREGWTTYTITPIIKALDFLPKFVESYNEGAKKIISMDVYGVKGQETAVITLRGPKARVRSFPTALVATNFYEHFHLREVEFPHIYIT